MTNQEESENDDDDFELETGMSSWIGLVAAVNILGIEPMALFELGTYLNPLLLITWLFMTIIVGVIIGLLFIALSSLGAILAGVAVGVFTQR